MPDTQAPPVRLSFSHVGIDVRDLPVMVDFYSRVLGFTMTDRGKVRGNDIVFLSWDPREHHQLVLVAARTTPLEINHLNQISFRVHDIDALRAAWLAVKDHQRVTDLKPVDHGNAWSVYFRDPEGNRIEIFCDTDWYIPQPCLRDLDLSQPAELIKQQSEAYCRASPGFRPATEFHAEVAAKIGLPLKRTP